MQSASRAAADGTPKLLSGAFLTNAQRDWTVKVIVDSLSHSTRYYFEFTVGAAHSDVGTFRLPPPPASRLDELRYAVFSCSSWSWGYFNAYRAAATQKHPLDFWVHVGDWQYEYGQAGHYPAAEQAVRWHGMTPVGETVTLADYRARHALTRSDTDLQALSASAPLIAVWDDHEIANDPWVGGAQNHDKDGAEGDWWWYNGAPYASPLYGTQQPLTDEIRTAARAYVAMAQFGLNGDFDGWDGYPAARERFLRALKDGGANANGRIAVYAGDSHAAWAGRLQTADGTPVALEFDGTSVTSSGPDSWTPYLPPHLLAKAYIDATETLEYANTADRGYLSVHLTRSTHTVAFMTVSAIGTIRGVTAKCDAAFAQDANSPDVLRRIPCSDAVDAADVSRLLSNGRGVPGWGGGSGSGSDGGAGGAGDVGAATTQTLLLAAGVGAVCVVALACVAVLAVCCVRRRRRLRMPAERKQQQLAEPAVA